MSYRQGDRVQTAEARHGPAAAERLSPPPASAGPPHCCDPDDAEPPARRIWPNSAAATHSPWCWAVCCWPPSPPSTRCTTSASPPTPTACSPAACPGGSSADELDKDFPQFSDLLVAVIDAQEPEEADATAAALADALAKDHTHFNSVRRPDASPFLRKEGLLFLDTKQLTDLMDRTIDAQPFLGQLVADPTARGLFSALSLLGMGVTQGRRRSRPLSRPRSRAFHQAMADALAGHPQPLSWQTLLGGGAERSRRQVPLRAGAAETGLRRAAARRRGDRRHARGHRAACEFVKSGAARVRITGRWRWRTRSSPPSRRAPSSG